MDTFELEKVCPKCGVMARHLVRFFASCSSEICKVATEHLHRVCNTCQYFWVEAPVSTGKVESGSPTVLH